MRSVFHCAKAESAGGGSRNWKGKIGSRSSRYPPGARALKARWKTAFGSLKQETRARPWMKSNFCGKVHSSSASSIRKEQLGGTLLLGKGK